MKRTPKPVFFIVALLIVALTYTSFVGVYSQYGDRVDTIIRGAKDIRFGVDIRGGVDVTFGPVDEGMAVTEEQMENIRGVIEQRLVSNNITDSEVYADVANKQVIARFPWKADETEFDAAAAIEELGQTAMLGFYIGDETEEVKDEDGNVVKDEYGNTVYRPTGELVIDGNDVDYARSTMQYNPQTGQSTPVVELVLKEAGREKFSAATKQQYEAGQEPISIWLDDQMLSAPSVSAHITDGVAVISGGNMDAAYCTELANLINSGALPFAIEVKGSGVLAPTLGEKALDAMVIAGVIAFALVALFMLIYYRLPGFVAVIALLGQTAGSIAAVSGYFGALNSFTLTLPGMAGIILSIGMGVDANIITAERIKEEVRAGKTIDGAIERGSKSSFWAIFDGNITVLIVAVVLMGVFGPPTGIWATVLKPLLFWAPVSTTGAVYSFGYTLFVGIVLNFVMGVGATRLMLKSISRFRFLRKPWLLGGKREGKAEKPKKSFDFIGRRRVFMLISLGIIVVGTVCSILMPIEMDIAFKGGTLIQYSFTGELEEEQVDAFVTEQLGREVDVPPTSRDMSGNSLIEITLTEQLTVEEIEALDAAMAERYGENQITQVKSNSLEPAMGRSFLFKCLVAVALAAVLLVIYVALRFRKIGGLSAGVMAVAALLNDLLIAFFAFVVFRIPLNDNFVAVLLTILGYSLNDTIVVYDRIRENKRLMDPKTPLREIVNLSLNQSFTRTLNTSVCTFLAIGTVAVIGVVMNLESIVSFAVPMMFGILSGFYTSVCLCSPIWTLWQERREKKAAKKAHKAEA